MRIAVEVILPVVSRAASELAARDDDWAPAFAEAVAWLQRQETVGFAAADGAIEVVLGDGQVYRATQMWCPCRAVRCWHRAASILVDRALFFFYL